MKILTILACFAWASGAWAMPSEIVILRHGEKPSQGNELNARGLRRAQALPQFLSASPEVNAHGPVAAVFATGALRAGASIRSIQTITPYSNLLGLPINESFDKDSVQDLVKFIQNDPALDGKTVVICYEHKVIPQMARGFGVSNPPDWDDACFDRVWIIQMDSDGAHLNIISQHLLPGDA